MDKLKIGSLITEPQVRDAIHVAIAPVIAAETLHPGQRIGLVDGKARASADIIGIVDPFLTHTVTAGAQFWIFLFPGSITSLAHHWTHPAFEGVKPKDAAKDAAIKWLTQFADANGISFDTLMEGARAWVSYEDYLCLGGLLEGCSVPDDFWPHFEIAAGMAVEHSKRGNFFTCSC